MEIVDYTSEGPAAWYRDVAKKVLRLVRSTHRGPATIIGRCARAHGSSTTLRNGSISTS